MNAAIDQAVRDVLPSVDKPPNQITLYASSLYYRSKAEIPLNGAQDAARTALCAYLSAEVFREKFKLPKPVAKKVPIRPKDFENLLSTFRTSLGVSSVPSTPQKRSVPTTPKKPSTRENSEAPATPTSRSRSKPESRIQTPKDAQLAFDDQIRQFTPLRGKERFAVGSPSPSKRKRGASGSPRKNKNEPTIEDIKEKCEALQLDYESIEAVSYGYRHYNKQIKEKWLFLAGLISVITKRAHPQLMNSSPNRRPFTSILSDLFPPGVNPDKVKEWQSRVEAMIGEHSWVKKVTVNRSQIKTSKRTENMLTIGDDDDDDDWTERMLKRIRVAL